MADAPALPMAVLLAGLPSAAYVLILNAIDRYEKEPWKLLIASIVLGAVAVPLLSMAILAALGQGFALPLGYASGGDPQPIARIVEQVVAAVLLLAFISTMRHEFDDTLDGIVYGAALGAGLGAAETFLYVVGGTGQLEGGTLALLLASGLNQAFYGAVFGAIAGTVSHWPDRRRAWLVTGLGVATAALLSSLHDTLPAMLSRVVERPDATTGVVTRALAFVINVLGILVLAVVVVAAWRRERRILHEYLEPEVAAGVASAADVAALSSFRSRLGRQTTALRGGSVARWRAIRQLDAAQGELAFHNWRTAVRRHKPSPLAGEALRRRIRDLRVAIDGDEGGRP